MTLFFLDTNVLTEGWKRRPDPVLEQWIDANDWLIPVPVIAEIQDADFYYFEPRLEGGHRFKA